MGTVCDPKLPSSPTEATERRFSGLSDTLLPQGRGRQLLVEAFHCRLKGPVLVDKKTLAELQGFQPVSGAKGQDSIDVSGT